MTKKSCIERNKKRKKLSKKHINKINNTIIKRPQLMNLFKRIQKKNSNKTRIRKRCPITGSSRGIYNILGISRMAIKKIAFYGLIPGIFKKNW